MSGDRDYAGVTLRVPAARKPADPETRARSLSVEQLDAAEQERRAGRVRAVTAGCATRVGAGDDDLAEVWRALGVLPDPAADEAGPDAGEVLAEALGGRNDAGPIAGSPAPGPESDSAGRTTRGGAT